MQNTGSGDEHGNDDGGDAAADDDVTSPKIRSSSSLDHSPTLTDHFSPPPLICSVAFQYDLYNINIRI